jgi:hypothetical protein
MVSPQNDKLTGDEWLRLEEMLGNSALMGGLRKIFAAEERNRLDGMRSEALGTCRVGEIVKYASESRICQEWETILKKGMERLAPQRR